MSQRNVESFWRGVEAFNRGDIDAFLEESHPDCVVYASMAARLGGESTIYRGHDEYRVFYKELQDLFSEFRIEVSEIREAGDHIAAVGTIHARGKESGADVESPIGYVIEFRDGKASRVDDYFEPEEAFAAIEGPAQ
jgi:ketosteroid isomerase-like protein